MPERGQIGIFNRSYYEEVLVVRVHPADSGEPETAEALVTKHIWQERFEDINNFERYATRNGIAVVKFFLHLSKKEQKRRFMERLDTPDKNWKFSSSDVKERQFWDAYQEAYEDMIRHTASEHAPWYVVPADNKWFTRLVVSQAVVDALKGMKLKYPKVSGAEKAALAASAPATRERVNGGVASMVGRARATPCAHMARLRIISIPRATPGHRVGS